MEFFHFLRRESEENFGRLVTVAVLAGLVNAVLVMILIQAASAADNGAASFRSFFLFGLSFGAFIYCRHFTVKRTGVLAERIITKVRARIIEKIRRTNLLQFERVGRSPVYSTVVQHTLTLSQSAVLIANSFSSGIMVVFVAGIIAYVSMPAFFLTAGSILVGIVIYRSKRSRIEATLAQATEEENRSFDYLGHLLDGFKEIRMHSGRNEDLYRNYLSPSANETERLKIFASDQIAFIVVLSQSYFYIVLAAIIFILPSYAQQASGSIAQVAALIVFMIGPLSEAVGCLPWLSRSTVAIANIEKLEATLKTVEATGNLEEIRLAREPQGFSELSCQELGFRYENGNGDTFGIGPINFNIRAGEIVFIVGGNGSGKSTFLKVLTGLYPSHRGVIQWNGRTLTAHNVIEYRSLFSTVFSDFHLFDRLYGLKDPEPNRLDSMLTEMQLEEKTRVEDGRFSTTHLSTGQRKRLALIVAQLENRPVLVFDEVAADQDPHFRKYFYEVMLRRWQQQGKTLIVVTHDDHYFQVADRILKMEYGAFENAPA